MQTKSKGLVALADAIARIAHGRRNQQLGRDAENVASVLREWDETVERIEASARTLRVAYGQVSAELERSERERDLWRMKYLAAVKAPGVRRAARQEVEGEMRNSHQVRELESEFARLDGVSGRLTKLAQRIASATDQSVGTGPRGFELRAASYDAKRDEFRVVFKAGQEYRLAASSLKLAGRVASAELDDLRHGVVVHLADGSQTSFASDLVLFECDPSYRKAHEPTPPARPLDFGARIRALRLRLGLQAKQVAAAAGLAASNYARLESSKHLPRVDTLVRVASALGVPLADLVSRRDVPATEPSRRLRRRPVTARSSR